MILNEKADADSKPDTLNTEPEIQLISEQCWENPVTRTQPEIFKSIISFPTALARLHFIICSILPKQVFL